MIRQVQCLCCTLIFFVAVVSQARSSEIETLRIDPAELLINAAAQGDVAKLRAQLSKRISVDVMSNTPSRATALIQASANGHREIVSLLIDSGALVDTVDGLGQTALSVAVYHGRTDVCKLLILAGADVNGSTDMAVKPVVAAVMSGNPALVELILNQGVNVKQSNDGLSNALVAAARLGDRLIVERLLQALKQTLAPEAARELLVVALTEARRAQRPSVVVTLSAELKVNIE